MPHTPSPNISPQLIAAELHDFLTENVLDPSVRFDYATPLTTIGVDSAAIVELLLFIESRFGVFLPDSELTRKNLESIATIAESLKRHINGATPHVEKPS